MIIFWLFAFKPEDVINGKETNSQKVCGELKKCAVEVFAYMLINQHKDANDEDKEKLEQAKKDLQAVAHKARWLEIPDEEIKELMTTPDEDDVFERIGQIKGADWSPVDEEGEYNAEAED